MKDMPVVCRTADLRENWLWSESIGQRFREPRGLLRNQHPGGISAGVSDKDRSTQYCQV